MTEVFHVQCQQCGEPMSNKNYIQECDYCLSKKSAD